ncbi:MAG: MFS transporter [Beijerinckiaceae bacterium]|nr:MFS transporter [Beijerinckiaceae bacterium]
MSDAKGIRKRDLGNRITPWQAWASFDVGQRPFNVLILSYIFAPYFAASLHTDPVRGQIAWGLTIALAGLAIAILAPLLGAVADAAGPKKPWIAVFGALLVAGSAVLWWARPGAEIAIPWAIAAVVVAIIGSELSIVFHNSLLPLLARRGELGRLSAFGWAMGGAGGVAALLVVLAALAIDPRTGLTIGGWAPAVSFDPPESTAGRMVGPLVAFWFTVFLIPMLLWMPDDRSCEKSFLSSARKGLKDLRTTIAELRKDRKQTTFLIAYLLFSDGLITLVSFGGVYAAGILGWGPIQLAGLGVVLGLVGLPALLITGRLDDRIGPQRIVTCCIVVLCFATIGLLGVDRNGFFGMTIAGLSGPHFFLVFAILIGLAGAPLQASSRTLMAHLAPRDRVTQMFGLLALSGRVTSFAGPALVALVTAATGSQRVGFSVALVFLLGGAALMLRLQRMMANEPQPIA